MSATLTKKSSNRSKGRTDKPKLADMVGQLAAISKSQAVIEFNLDGTILKANENFLKTVGYTLDEIQGRHHSTFMPEAEKNSAAYREFWAKLNQGEFVAGEFCRIGKGGKEIWIQASYNPIFDQNGKPFKVVKFAADITAMVNKRSDMTGQLSAISKSQAVIEFNLDGTILTANENFLKTVGYSLDEIKGRHHSTFMPEADKNSLEYQAFWAKLNRGEYVAGEFLRVGKGGKEIWIQASYNPILDPSGKPFKVVKYASDITQMVKNRKEAFLLSRMLEQTSFNIMYANRDLTIEYINPSSINTLRKLQNYLPIPVDKILGQSIDIFHKNPAHQRKLLSDPKNLPYKAQFMLATENVDFIAVAIMSEKGEFMGIMVSWEIISERVKTEMQIKENAEREKLKATEMAKILDKVNSNASMLASSAEELTAVSTQMAANAEETSVQANVVSAASEQVSKNVQTVSTGVEEMNSAIREIAKNASDSARVAQKAVVDAQAANTIVSKLGDSSIEIGKVIKVITSIAEQTNLLALNATIEAARAGEAGKGFAVVANEVKELAKETARATEDISSKIETIQTDTKGAVDSIKQISEVIVQINDISNTIASAVEEQTATAAEMSRNVGEAAKGTAEIAQNITSVAQAAQNTTQGATNCQQAAGELSRMAAELQQVGASQSNVAHTPSNK
jgi:methyl-accepting chemotaxis protein